MSMTSLKPTGSIDLDMLDYDNNRSRVFLKMEVQMKLRIALRITISVTAMFLSQFAQAQTVKSLYSFTGANSSGNPGFGTLAQGRNGKLYGTTFGPAGTGGSVFAITTAGKETQPFTFGIDGTNPWAGLTLGTDGNYYGTTSAGGPTGNGVLFKLSPTGEFRLYGISLRDERLIYNDRQFEFLGRGSGIGTPRTG